MDRLSRVGIVGASSLIGRELAEELKSSSFAAADVVLLDEEDVIGQVASIGDEASFIQRIDPGTFEGMDLCFFAGKPEDTLKHWQAARRAGAGIIDLTNALAGLPGVLVQAPWVTGALDEAGLAADLSQRLDLHTEAVIPAHPVAIILGLIAARCMRLGLVSIASTLLEPASERGQAGLDEMHQQAVNLLSFQTVPRKEFDAQVAFNLLPALGEAARVKVQDTSRRIQADYKAATDGLLPSLILQIVHAPVFHGYGLSILLEFDRTVSPEQIEHALTGEHIEVLSEESQPPSNLSAAGQANLLVCVDQSVGSRVWLWLSADNLKITALQAIDCARVIQTIRPYGKVQ